MPVKKQDMVSRWLLGQFKRGAIVVHYGYEDSDIAMKRAGKKSVKLAMILLDDYGREVLIPLLEDSDPGVRAYAAAYLLETMPERAMAVLVDVKDNAPTKARDMASRLLEKHAKGESIP